MSGACWTAPTAVEAASCTVPAALDAASCTEPAALDAMPCADEVVSWALPMTFSFRLVDAALGRASRDGRRRGRG